MYDSTDLDAKAPKARWIDTAEVAKMIRRQLKKAHAGVKFSVRLDRYSGGSSIDIRWTDGPTVKTVEQTTAAFAGRRFDGMIDLQYGADSWYCEEHGARVARTYGHGMGLDALHESRCCGDAELVHFGASFVFENRTLSPEFSAELAAKVRKDCGMADWGSNDERLPEGSRWQYNPHDRVWDGIHRLSVETTCSS
jgi:hypothetical protein